MAAEIRQTNQLTLPRAATRVAGSGVPLRGTYEALSPAQSRLEGETVQANSRARTELFLRDPARAGSDSAQARLQAQAGLPSRASLSGNILPSDAGSASSSTAKSLPDTSYVLALKLKQQAFRQV